jgi:hypothetical protein
MERKKLISREDFFEEFQVYMDNEYIVPDSEGRLDGNCVFSIYNEDK